MQEGKSSASNGLQAVPTFSYHKSMLFKKNWARESEDHFSFLEAIDELTQLLSALTITDDVLVSLTDVIALKFELIEKLSLVGNIKLGLLPYHRDDDQDGALADFIRRFGRRCTHLNLWWIPHLRSQDLSGLVSDVIHDDPPRLKQLALNNTDLDNNAAPYIACCPSLVALEVAGTKLTSTGLFPIIDACPKPEELDLTSCRGIKVADHRRFFEVWESEWKDA